jgi:putative membrane protein insertion efficiency factor
MNGFFLFLIKSYQNWISPFLKSQCRFTPSCSSYATQAIENKGLMVGLVLSFKRLLKCHPFHPGGFDPVE